jgi:hypothetical protein
MSVAISFLFCHTCPRRLLLAPVPTLSITAAAAFVLSPPALPPLPFFLLLPFLVLVLVLVLRCAITGLGDSTLVVV